MPMRNLLDLIPFTSEEVEGLITRAAAYKKGETSQHLLGQSIGLIFEKVSTRTRVAFEVAVARLGGHPIFLSFADIQLNRGETIADTARVLSSYLDALVIRTYAHEKLVEWARYATIPVMNGLTDLHHPCQALSDLFTIYERRGDLKGLKLVYVGDGNNVAHSLMEAGALMGMHVTVAAPEGFSPDPKIVQEVQEVAQRTGGKVAIVTNAREAARMADILYTDVWVSMGQEKEKQERREAFAGYQINAQLVSRAKADCLVMHCLPAYREEEITSEVMDATHSIIFDQAANRLPMHQAILEMCVDGRH